jgi:hypothetical protein
MSTKIKVNNKNPFNVGIKFMDNVREVNIPKNGFMMLEEEEIYFQNTQCLLFKKGILTVDNAEINENIGITSQDVALSDQEIEAILKYPLAKMKKELSVVTEPHILSKIFEIAKKTYANLTGSKVDFISELCNRDSEDLKPIKEKVTKNKRGK